MTTSTPCTIAPTGVHEALARHIHADDSGLVVDFERSHDARLHDSRPGREYLDSGLTGRMGAHEHSGLEPGTVTLVASGDSQTASRPKPAPAWWYGWLGSRSTSSRASPRINSTCAGGLTEMVRFGRFREIIQEEALVCSARARGDRLLEGLRALEAGGTATSSRGRRTHDRLRPADAGVAAKDA